MVRRALRSLAAKRRRFPEKGPTTRILPTFGVNALKDFQASPRLGLDLPKGEAVTEACQSLSTIAHISDLHFGCVDRKVAQALLDDLDRIRPTVVAVSGDLTQQGSRRQFAAARDYLRAIPYPLLVVPGNHDIPLFASFNRYTRPLRHYQQYINRDLKPFYGNDYMAMMGISTAWPMVWRSGRISITQRKDIRAMLFDLKTPLLKVLVTHHPFLPPPAAPGKPVVGRARRALEVIEDCEIDLLLAGHYHMSYTGDAAAFFPTAARSTLVVQAGTATSRFRPRGPNSYNVIRLHGLGEVSVEVRNCANGSGFMPAERTRYARMDGTWKTEEHESYPTDDYEENVLFSRRLVKSRWLTSLRQLPSTRSHGTPSTSSGQASEVAAT